MDEAALQGGLAPYVIRLGVTLLLVLANGFFVSAEFALVKVRRTRLDALVAEGNGRARVARHLVEHLDHYLSACQLGNTFASLILGWLAEPAVAQLLVAGVGALGYQVVADSALTHAVALALALVVVTVLHMTVGEQAPKIWAIRRAESTALVIAYPLRLFAALFRPFIWFVNALSHALLRSVGLAAAEYGESHDIEEIRVILATSAAAGQLTERQQQLTANVLNLVELEVRHILVPRVDVTLLSTRKSVAENVQTILASGHSRFPLCDGDLDAVRGIVHVKDMTAALLRGVDPDLQRVMRQPLFVGENRSLASLIEVMQREANHCAVVLDEYGTAVGLAFLEDALEQVVGTIRDEFDSDSPAPTLDEHGAVSIPGGMSLPEATALLGLQGLEDTADTIGGHIVSQLGKLPEQGDEVRVGDYRVTVTAAARHRIEWLRFEPVDDDSSRSSEDPAAD